MATRKIAITLEEDLLRSLDRLVALRIFPNRSRAIQAAVSEKLQNVSRSRLARECEKLDKKFEQAMAEEGMNKDIAQWPEY